MSGRRRVALALGAVALVAAIWAAAEWGSAGGQPGQQAAEIGRGIYLTGDGWAVALEGSLHWRRTATSGGAQPAEMALAAPALFRAAAVAAAASHKLDDWVPAPSAAAREAMAAALNRELGTFGVAAARIDLRAAVPAELAAARAAAGRRARDAADQLETAAADAVRLQAAADRDRVAILASAHAAAAERLAGAHADMAPIVALEQRYPTLPPGLLDRLYRERIGAILGKAGSVTAIDAKAVSRVILPSAQP